AQFTFGDMARNSNVRSDNAKNVDFSIFKNFSHRREVSAQLSRRGVQLNESPAVRRPEYNTRIADVRSGALAGEPAATDPVRTEADILVWSPFRSECIGITSTMPPSHDHELV